MSNQLTIMTLNLHCFEEKSIEMNQQKIVQLIIDQHVDVICFQEVAQTKINKENIDSITEDNYVYELQRMLNERGNSFDMIYAVSNVAFNNYDEGVAILSRFPIKNRSKHYISKTKDYNDWTTRVMLSTDIDIGQNVLSFHSVHFGWTDANEQFKDQFDEAVRQFNQKTINIMMGDFNIQDISHEYVYVSSMLYDLFLPISSVNGSKTFNDWRIDYIMSTHHLKVIKKEVIFKKPNNVSDHHGILITLEFD